MAVDVDRREWAKNKLDRKARRREARLADLERATTERDDAIRAAIEAGLPRSRIAQSTGLSRQRINQIARGARL